MGWRWLWEEIMTTVLVVDRGLLYTLRQMFSRPGHTIREYLGGRRKPHLKPLAFVALSAAAYSLLYMWFFKVEPEMLGADRNTQRMMEMANRMMGDYYALFELATIPILAFITRIAFRSWGHNFVEHVVINAFLSGQRIVINILILPMNLAGTVMMFGATSLAFMAYGAAMLVCFIQLYQERRAEWVMARLSIVALMLVVLLIMVPIIIGVAYAIQTRSA